MKQNGSIELFEYWNRLRAGRPAPARQEVEPADIKALLADTFILERDWRNAAVFRLAGTRLCATYGRELKGFSFPSLWREKDQRLASRLADNVFQSHSVVVIGFQGTSRSGRGCGFEMLLLPLDGGVNQLRCLGIVTSIERPFWLGADPVNAGHIDSVRVIDPEREPIFLRNRLPIGLDDDDPLHFERPVAQTAALNARRIRHLVVHEGGRTD